MKYRKIPYILSLWLVVLLAKLWYQECSWEQLSFILQPLKSILEGLISTRFTYTTNGYLCPEGYLITKDCSGFNFLLISFLTLGFSLGKKFNYNLIAFLATSLLAYTLTLFANTSRIISLISCELFFEVDSNLHLAIGTIVYLSILLIAYAFIHPPLNRKNNATISA